MKRSKFSEEQVAYALRQVEAGTAVPDICRQLGVSPSETAFLDDIGTNLKTAKALGMHTIKVNEPAQALRELGALVGFPLS